MKTIFLFITVLFLSVSADAQIKKVSLQASGLTCSMCNNAINKALKTVSFVDKVNADIQTATFEITFKPGSTVDFETLKKKVEGAGFFVSKFMATIQFKNVAVKENKPVTVGNKTFQFINIKSQALNGEKTVRVMNKGYISAKEYKKNALPVTANSKVYVVSI